MIYSRDVRAAFALQENRPLLIFASAYILWGYADALVYHVVGLDGPAFWAVSIGVPTAFLAMLYWANAMGVIPGASYGLIGRGSGRQLTQDAIFCYVTFVVIVFFARELVSLGVDIGKAVVKLDGALPPGAAQLGNTMLLCVGLSLGSVLEEVVYRGMLRKIFSAPRDYVPISTALFAGVHFHQGLVTVLIAAIVGLAACALYLRMRTLLPLLLAHVGTNLTVVATI